MKTHFQKISQLWSNLNSSTIQFVLIAITILLFALSAGAPMTGSGPGITQNIVIMPLP